MFTWCRFRYMFGRCFNYVGFVSCGVYDDSFWEDWLCEFIFTSKDGNRSDN